MSQRKLFSGQHDRGPTTIDTHSGRAVNLANPRPSDIHLADISHAMSLLCRFGGQCSRFYSIAEHSVLVHDLVREWLPDGFSDMLLAALLHDAHEAYLGDVVSPLKHKLQPAYDTFRAGFDGAIGLAFGLPQDQFQHGIIKRADHDALFCEGAALLGAEFWKEEAIRLPDSVEWAGGLGPSEARELFESRAAELLRRRHIEDQQQAASVGSQGNSG